MHASIKMGRFHVGGGLLFAVVVVVVLAEIGLVYWALRPVVWLAVHAVRWTLGLRTRHLTAGQAP